MLLYHSYVQLFSTAICSLTPSIGVIVTWQLTQFRLVSEKHLATHLRSRKFRYLRTEIQCQIPADTAMSLPLKSQLITPSYHFIKKVNFKSGLSELPEVSFRPYTEWCKKSLNTIGNRVSSDL